MHLTYLGTACVLLELSGMRLLTDPAFDPRGTRYHFGPWYAPKRWFESEKVYTTPMEAGTLGPIDAVLLTHDHHADNLDYAGRALLAGQSVASVVTTPEAASRLMRPPPTGRTSEPGEGLGRQKGVVG